MSSNQRSALDLPWLPRLSDSFRQDLRSIRADSAQDWGLTLRALATQNLGLNQAMAIVSTLRQLRAVHESPSLTPFRLGIVSNATLDFVVPSLQAAALRYGIALDVVAGAFDQMTQEALDPASAVNRSRPDAVLIAADCRGLPFTDAGSSAGPQASADAALAEITAMRDGFRKNAGAVCLVQSLAAPLNATFGSLDAALPGTLRSAISDFNATLARTIAGSGDILVDVEWLAQSVGLHQWNDERTWYLGRMPFAQQALPLYADFVVRVVAAMRGKSRKCLILDLDNTIWGGVIGDDGVDGIALSQGDPRGEAYRAVQLAAAELRRRGVVLAVCSKNDEDKARQPFRSHSGMVLKEDDIAVFVANWDDKASNIERIAERLELGLDAMVLLDDNPAERAQVRQAIPLVAVPELGDDPSDFVRRLTWAGYFESISFTNEDLQRAGQYKVNADRLELKERSRDLADFLRSLQMEVELRPFDAAGRKRITQLINKTNQFNVMTRRYSEPQIEAMESSAAHHTLQVTVRDRFGDNGMIGVVICEKSDREWTIDSWLMSCRVLNRRVEEAVCNRLARDAVAAGAKRLIGRYQATERNGIVADLFARLGFARSGVDGGVEHWVLDLLDYRSFDVPLVEKS